MFGMHNNVIYCKMHINEAKQSSIVLHERNDEFYQQHAGYAPHIGGHLGAGHPGEPWFSPNGSEFPMVVREGEFAYANNNEPMLKKRRGRKKKKVEPYPMHEFLDGSFAQGAMLDPTGAQCKTPKRARTSFKHNQLRIMKAHFALNQNPDSRELKMLSGKTGLDKKVLQVIFRCGAALATEHL